MLSVEYIVEECTAARPGGRAAIAAVVERLVARPAELKSALGAAEAPGIRALFRSADLTVLDFCWAPSMTLPAHDHRMEAAIGIISGREDNLLWRLGDGSLECVGARSLGAGEVIALGAGAIHSVTNPLDRGSRALHVYLGDFFEPPQPRREWDAETLEERPWSADRTRARFERAALR